MFDIKDILQQEFEFSRVKIIENMVRNDQMVSGRTANSLRVETTEKEGVLWGADYFDTLETGISPFESNKHPFSFTYYKLKSWYHQKGITNNASDDSRIGMATVNQREIGSLLFRSTKGTPTGNVFRKEINPLVTNIGNRIGDLIINTKILP